MELRDREVSGRGEPHLRAKPVWPSRVEAERSRPQEASELIRFLELRVAEAAVTSPRRELQRPQPMADWQQVAPPQEWMAASAERAALAVGHQPGKVPVVWESL